MIPNSPIRGLVRGTPSPSSLVRGSVLAIDVVVAVVEGVDARVLERLDGSHQAGEMHDPRRVLARDRRLDRLARPRAQREDAVAAHQNRGRAMGADRLDDAAPDLLAPDQ